MIRFLRWDHYLKLQDYSDSKRTKHPVYSFSSFGPITNDLLKIENKTAYGIDSPFQNLEKLMQRY